jgi:hypothetical protein
MSRRRRIPLNPCDYLYYAHHRMLSRTAGGGSLAYMSLDTEGAAAPEHVVHALEAVMAAHPVIFAPLRASLLTGWPRWCVSSSAGPAARHAAEQAFCYEDLRSCEDWADRLELSSRRRYTACWNLAIGPNIRFEQYDLPANRTRFRLLWPHFLMDAEGAQWFLIEIARQLQQVMGSSARAAAVCGTGVPPPIPADAETIDMLAGRSIGQRLRLFRRGFTLHGEHRRLSLRSIAAANPGPLDSLGLLHRHWSPEQLGEVQSKAKKLAPPGRALYARYLAACVVRALHRLHLERNVPTDAYLITFPMRPSWRALDTRPVPGNYLVSPTLCLRKEAASDKQSLGQEILRQLEHYRVNDGDVCQWAMVWMASFLRTSFYDLVFRLPLGFEALTSGFSYYGEIEPPIRFFGGLPVINLFGGGPLGSPPGWNPVFSRFQDRLNFSLTWNRPAIGDHLAHRYVELIEQEMFT